MKNNLTLKLIVFYFLSFTWGIIMSTIGGLVILFSACFKRVHVFHHRLYAVWGKDWGGLELGCFFITCESCANDDDLRAHEAGHGIQNCLWGPLFPLVIGIPSAIRYWYREYLHYIKKINYYDMKPYDAIWFEGQATRWGKKYVLTDRI